MVFLTTSITGKEAPECDILTRDGFGRENATMD
jgi:hypothetical protein